MLLVLAACAADPMVEVPGFGDNPGSLRMFERAPLTGEGPPPLLLVLHGCLQDHGLAADAGLLGLAPAAVVVAAEQRWTNNPQGCFDWFLPGDTAPGEGEVGSLAAMVEDASGRYGVDPERVGVFGVSAGGAMAFALVAARPDLFTAAVAAAGAPVGCADLLAEATTCLTDPGARSPEEWGDEVRGEGPWPRVMVVQGDDDPVVSAAVSDAVVAQWASVHGLPLDEAVLSRSTSARGDVTHTRLGAGEVERLRYEGVGHELPVDPDAGCGTAGPFLPDVGDCLAARALGFLGLDGG